MKQDTPDWVWRWCGWPLLILGVFSFCFAAFRVGLSPRHDNDFKHIYLGALLIKDGVTPYSLEAMGRGLQLAGLSPQTPLNPYVYLPFTGLVMSPLTWLNLREASTVWFWANILCVLGSVWFIAECCVRARLHRAYAWGALLVFFAFSFPMHRTLTAGQLTCPLMLAMAAAFYCYGRERFATAGVLLGFAAMFKIAPGFFLIHFLLTRSWRSFWAMFATCCVLGVVSLAVCGLQMHLDFLPMLRDMGFGRSTWFEHGMTFWKDSANQSLNSFFTHIAVRDNGVCTAWFGATQAVGNAMTWAAVAAIIGVYGYGAWRGAADAERRKLSFLSAIVCSLLVPSLYWDHYAILLTLPCTVVAWPAIDRKISREWAMGIVGLICLLLLGLPWNYNAEAHREGAGILLMSLKLWPTLALFGLLAYLQREIKKKSVNFSLTNTKHPPEEESHYS